MGSRADGLCSDGMNDAEISNSEAIDAFMSNRDIIEYCTCDPAPEHCFTAKLDPPYTRE